MSRRRWVGLVGLLFGALMIVGVLASGTTPDTDTTDAAEKYAKYWADSGHQDRAQLGSLLLSYACVALAALTAGLRYLLRRVDDGPLPSVVLVAGSAATALLGSGAMLLNGSGFAGVEGNTAVDGDLAMIIESIGYYTATTGMMCGALMAVAVAISNRRVRLLPQWTMVIAALIALAALGSIYSGFVLFMLLPIWAIVVGICLLVQKDDQALTS